MGAPLTEFVFETVIRDGLGELRSNPDLLNDIFSRFLEAHFANQYGQVKIDELKTYIVENQIRIVQSWAMVPTSTPCISIQLINQDETEDDQNLGNEFPELDESKTPAILIPVVTPGTYDSLTGKLTVTNSADLSTVCPGLIFVDSSGTKFTIGSGNSNFVGNKFINIGIDQNPDLGGDGHIESPIDFTRSEIRFIRLRETIHLGCHAKDDIHLAKYLFTILVYILKSRQESLIQRGIGLDRGTGTIHDRDDEYEGENVFSRIMEVNCLTNFSWNQGEVSIADCFDLTVRTPEPDPDSEDTQVVSPTDCD